MYKQLELGAYESELQNTEKLGRKVLSKLQFNTCL